MLMSKKKVIFFILVGFELAVLIPLAIGLIPTKPRTRYMAIVAKKYGYFPSRIVANKGDTIVLSLSSLDVPHGFSLDGYPADLIMKKGAMFQKHTEHHHTDKLMTGWSRVARAKFVANKTGKFTFRCTQICGNLHPFMTGEMVVRPNTPYHLFISLSVWVTFSLLVLYQLKDRSRHAGF